MNNFTYSKYISSEIKNHLQLPLFSLKLGAKKNQHTYHLLLDDFILIFQTCSIFAQFSSLIKKLADFFFKITSGLLIRSWTINTPEIEYVVGNKVSLLKTFRIGLAILMYLILNSPMHALRIKLLKARPCIFKKILTKNFNHQI